MFSNNVHTQTDTLLAEYEASGVVFRRVIMLCVKTPRPGGESRGEEKGETEAIMNKHETTESIVSGLQYVESSEAGTKLSEFISAQPVFTTTEARVVPLLQQRALKRSLKQETHARFACRRRRCSACGLTLLPCENTSAHSQSKKVNKKSFRDVP